MKQSEEYRTRILFIGSEHEAIKSFLLELGIPFIFVFLDKACIKGFSIRACKEIQIVGISVSLFSAVVAASL